MRFCLSVLFTLILLSCTGIRPKHVISTATLLDEMVDLHRLTKLSEISYRTVQFSSYDRRSTSRADSCWFANEDGFGNEPVPGFVKVLKQPDKEATGEYLICDVRQPGAIMRLWTAGLNGKIRLFLDNNKSPVYYGAAQDFFWKTAEVMSGQKDSSYADIFRQFDASYFPIPFARSCRIEWIGDISEIHFYHVGIRTYEHGVKVKTFDKADFKNYLKKIEEVKRKFADPGIQDSPNTTDVEIPEVTLPDSGKVEIFNNRGTKAIENFALRISAPDPECALRKSILTIYFDDSSIPQVEAPVGDFFGSAPGLNAYTSLPFAVQTDSLMSCRFIMPFKRSARIELQNYSGQEIKCRGELRVADINWENGKTMQFHARWRVDHGITAAPFDDSKNSVQDILFLMASGEGRIVGTGAFIFNPSNATTSWGNWWGEGDEKIFVDSDTFPSFFGTGTEDYFNYSWSSSRIFSYPYCGQPRNDGPGNRGYVSNFRWHISDDIPFSSKIAFYMELGHHGIVPGFSYGRIVYFYALPEVLDNYRKISVPEIRYLPYPVWHPIAYLGSAGFRYIQAEKLISESAEVKLEKQKIASDGSIIMWKPVKKGDKITLKLPSSDELKNTILGLTLLHNPSGCAIAIAVNGKSVKFDGKDTINLFEPSQTLLANHFSTPLEIKKGRNEIVLESMSDDAGKRIGLDFAWLKVP